MLRTIGLILITGIGAVASVAPAHGESTEIAVDKLDIAFARRAQLIDFQNLRWRIRALGGLVLLKKECASALECTYVLDGAESNYTTIARAKTANGPIHQVEVVWGGGVGNWLGRVRTAATDVLVLTLDPEVTEKAFLALKDKEGGGRTKNVELKFVPKEKDGDRYRQIITVIGR